MRNLFLAALAAGMSLFCPAAAWAQANACDLNQDGLVNLVDTQLAVNMALGLAPCRANVAGSGVCNVVVIQRVTNAALTVDCLTGVPGSHNVALTWTASTSSNVSGYNVYRSAQAAGPYTKLTSALVAWTIYTDYAVQAGQTYYYVTTAVDYSNNESIYSNQATAVIPTP